MLTPEQQRRLDGDYRNNEQVELDRRAASLSRLLGKAKRSGKTRKPRP